MDNDNLEKVIYSSPDAFEVAMLHQASECFDAKQKQSNNKIQPRLQVDSNFSGKIERAKNFDYQEFVCFKLWIALDTSITNKKYSSSLLSKRREPSTGDDTAISSVN